MSTKSKEVLNSLAKIAADGYLKSGKSLTDSLKKTASQESLLPHQVEYVAAEANKLVWAHHYKNDKKAAYDFPIANPNEVIKEAQIAPVEKLSSSMMDYMLPPTGHSKTASEKSIYGEFKTEITDVNDRRCIKHQLQSRYEKLAAAKEDAEAQMIITQARIDRLTDKFVKEARVMIMQTPFLERPAAMEKIAEFVRGTGKVSTGKELMRKLANKVVRDGLVKEADLKAPEEYISETLPARVINGNHSLYITIDTIVKEEHCLSNMRKNFIIADDTLPVLKEKIRGL